MSVICFTVKVSVSNLKVDKSKNLNNAFYIFTFFDMTLQKLLKKSRYCLDFEKKVKKHILELWHSCTQYQCPGVHFTLAIEKQFRRLDVAAVSRHVQWSQVVLSTSSPDSISQADTDHVQNNLIHSDPLIEEKHQASSKYSFHALSLLRY